MIRAQVGQSDSQNPRQPFFAPLAAQPPVDEKMDRRARYLQFLRYLHLPDSQLSHSAIDFLWRHMINSVNNLLNSIQLNQYKKLIFMSSKKFTK